MKKINRVELVIGTQVIAMDAQAFYSLLQCYDFLNTDGTLPFAISQDDLAQLRDCRDSIEIALHDLVEQQPHHQLPQRPLRRTMDS